MINCFPRLYKDELLYSAVSRYRRMCGLANKEAISRDFIYKQNEIFQTLFPLRLNKIAEIFPIGSKITGEKLLYEHTMYPFYTKLLSKEIQNEIKDYMLNRDDVNIFLKLGTGNIVKQNQYLKGCNFCKNEDVNKFGESYWRREHQFSGIFFCSKHKVQLQESEVICSSINRDYVCFDDLELKNKNLIDNKYINYNLQYINLVKELIEEKEIHLKLDTIKEFYKDKLYQRDFTTKSGRIYIKKLAYEFKEFYSEEYLNFMNSDIKSYDNNWIMNFFSKNNNKPIVRHLLLLQFLNCSVKDIIEYTENRCYEYVYKVYMPKLDLEERKKDWSKIIKENPQKSRNELIKVNPKIYSYVYKYDKEWYERVTPKLRRKRKLMVDWDKKDIELLGTVKEVVKQILSKQDKPIKVCNASIRRKLGMGQGIFNSKLVKTKTYINEVTENNNDYWIRKIKWAIEELNKNEELITIYKIQMKCGFSNNLGGKIKELIRDTLEI